MLSVAGTGETEYTGGYVVQYSIKLKHKSHPSSEGATVCT